MKAHKITLLIVDHDDIGTEEVQTVIEEAYYPNHCISPKVMRIETVDIGEWSDDHLLNNRFSMKDEFERLFGGINSRDVYAVCPQCGDYGIIRDEHGSNYTCPCHLK